MATAAQAVRTIDPTKVRTAVRRGQRHAARHTARTAQRPEGTRDVSSHAAERPKLRQPGRRQGGQRHRRSPVPGRVLHARVLGRTRRRGWARGRRGRALWRDRQRVPRRGGSYPTDAAAATAPRTRHCQPTPVMAAGGWNRLDRLCGLSPDRGGQRQCLRRPRGRRPKLVTTATACTAAGWHAANPGAWTAAGWTAGYAWTPATWPAVGASLGWAAGIQPIAYNYGSNVTYQDDQVYYGNQPVATAEQYYQQASTLAQSGSGGRRDSRRVDASGRVRLGPERAVRPAIRHAVGRQQVRGDRRATTRT